MSLDLPAGLRCEVQDAIAILTIDRPEVHNAFTPEMREAIDHFGRALDDDAGLRAAVVTGAGSSAFCAGADLKVTVPAARGGNLPQRPPTERFFSRVAKPVIAAVNGLCIGGGLELMLGTDIRVVAEHASFALSEVRWGLIPGGGGSVRLPSQIPFAIAMEMLLIGEPIDAARALQLGLVNRVVAADQVLVTAVRLATQIAANAPLAVQAAKRVVIDSLDLERSFGVEAAYVGRVLATNDVTEGLAAFAEHRPAHYRGR